MWLTAGPLAAFPLALLLLRRTYAASQPQLRRRAFDLIANLQACSLAVEMPHVPLNLQVGPLLLST